MFLRLYRAWLARVVLRGVVGDDGNRPVVAVG